MSDSQRYDSIVIGSGQSGGPLSTQLVKSGRKTALIERAHVGGTCINEGCTPTKTMVASARVAYLASRSEDYGVRIDTEHVDMEIVVRRKRDIVTRFRDGSAEAIKAGGVDLIMGEAAFSSPTSIDVNLRDGSKLALVAREFFIDTGGRPTKPEIEGLETVRSLNSTTIMELEHVPEHLIVLGGGYVGVEFAQMFRRFGSRVTVVQRGPVLLTREDSDVASEVAEILRQDGVEILLDSTTTRVDGNGNGTVRVYRQFEGGERSIAGTHLLVAVGRTPNTESLNAAAAGVDVDRQGFVQVNDRLETTAPNIWAMGDVAGSPPFTHISYDDFRIVRDNLLHGANRNTKDRLVPYTVFIDPQLGRVGLGEEEARRQGRNIKVAKVPMTSVARALEVDESRGMVKAVVDADTGQILGAAVLGLEGGEIMAMFEIAMMGRVQYAALREGIFAHPTLAELLNTLFSDL
jgi:pyruvate/2-oxoglutarate dehydrogenase complex dihydrolipoamide dehydrogenase (E3) component